MERIEMRVVVRLVHACSTFVIYKRAWARRLRVNPLTRGAGDVVAADAIEDRGGGVHNSIGLGLAIRVLTLNAMNHSRFGSTLTRVCVFPL